MTETKGPSFLSEEQPKVFSVVFGEGAFISSSSFNGTEHLKNCIDKNFGISAFNSFYIELTINEDEISVGFGLNVEKGIKEEAIEEMKKKVLKGLTEKALDFFPTPYIILRSTYEPIKRREWKRKRYR